MKKKHFAIFVFAIALVFGAQVSVAQASDINGVIESTVGGEQVVWASGNVGQRITGTLSDRGRADCGKDCTDLAFSYIYNPKGEDFNDLAGIGYLRGEQETECTVNPKNVAEGKLGYNDFVCETLDENLAVGTYTFVIGRRGTVTWTSYMDNRTFTIKGFVAKVPSVLFSSVSVSGSRVTVNMSVANIPEGAEGRLELGVASQQGKTVHYSCSAGGPASDTERLPKTDDTHKTITFNFSGVPDGNYCIRALGIIPKQASFYFISADTDGEGFFTAQNALFSVGGAKLDPNATIDPTANATGCVTNGDNTNYCFLAPLPGLGDDSGNFDVTTGFSKYINTIISLFFGIIGVLSVLMIVVGGIEYMSTVSMGEKEDAKTRITNALFGLLLALSAYLILKTIMPKLVDGGITIPSVSIEVSPDTFKRTSGGGAATGGGSVPNVKQNITTYDSMLKKAASDYGIECTLLKAFMYAESGGNPNAKSSVGARGLIQLMPETFRSLGFDTAKIDDPATNINAGAKYIAQLKSTACNGSGQNSVCSVADQKYIIAAYNGGPKANGFSDVCKKGQNVDTTAWQCTLNSGYAETRNYVPKVLGNRQKLIDNSWGC